MNNTTTPHNANDKPFAHHNEQTNMSSATTKPKRKAITIERVMEQCENDEYEGICLACGEDAQGVEPDAREYECESCGKEKVFGCEELLFMIG
jgi:hypothetical protein